MSLSNRTLEKHKGCGTRKFEFAQSVSHPPSLLYGVLPEAAQAQAVKGWMKLWAEDFQQLLHTVDKIPEIEKTILALPRLKSWSKYIVRAKTFVEKYQEIWQDAKKLKPAK